LGRVFGGGFDGAVMYVLVMGGGHKVYRFIDVERGRLSVC
jgi:hypothetical protein